MGTLERETLVVSDHYVSPDEFKHQRKLVVRAVMRLCDGSEVPVMALIDA